MRLLLLVGLLLQAAVAAPSPSYDTVDLAMRLDDCDRDDEACAWVELRYPWFTAPGDEAVTGRLRSLVDESMLAPVIGEDPARSPAALASGFLHSYRELLAEGFESPAGWWLQREMVVEWIGHRALTLRTKEIAWAGGAHPNHVDTLIVAAHDGGSIELADVLLPGSEETLRELGEAAFRAYHGLPPEEPLADLGFWFDAGFELNDNWGATGDGLVFHFNPYEVAAYALGHTEIVLEWSRVGPLLRPDSALGEMAAPRQRLDPGAGQTTVPRRTIAGVAG